MPPWIKSTIVFWKDGQISDDQFDGEIQYLVDNKIIKFNVNASK
jgi:hypothetical protein